MNIWDSVHRGLDKASKEAARIARGQRLRAQIDKASRQINTQESALLHQVMDLFTSGRLIQGELLPLCHELMSLQQQLSQAQSELQTLQSQGPLPPLPGQTAIQGDMNTQQTTLAPLTGASISPGYTPPPPPSTYPPVDATLPAIPPPPPPPSGENWQTLHSQETMMNTILENPVESTLTVSEQKTIITPEGGTPQGDVSSKPHCPQCGIETLPGHSFCQNCGAALTPQGSDYQPTIRADSSSYPQGQDGGH
ncbi:MAG: hypothetical protein NVS2B12_31530 [Ktedonobacteraceae bacterium]